MVLKLYNVDTSDLVKEIKVNSQNSFLIPLSDLKPWELMFTMEKRIGTLSGQNCNEDSSKILGEGR